MPRTAGDFFALAADARKLAEAETDAAEAKRRPPETYGLDLADDDAPEAKERQIEAHEAQAEYWRKAERAYNAEGEKLERIEARRLARQAAREAKK